MTRTNGHAPGVKLTRDPPVAPDPAGTEAFAVWAATLALYRSSLLAAGIPEGEVLALTASLQSQLFERMFTTAPSAPAAA